MAQGLSYDRDTILLIDRGTEALRRATREMMNAWGFGRTKRWDADLDAGTITFTDPGLIAVAPVQVIGSYMPEDRSWLWAWGNPNVPEAVTRHARLVYDYGSQRNIGRFIEPEIECTEEDAWAFTGLAFLLAGAKGAYRGPAEDSLYVFMTFGFPTIQDLSSA